MHTAYELCKCRTHDQVVWAWLCWVFLQVYVLRREGSKASSITNSFTRSFIIKKPLGHLPICGRSLTCVMSVNSHKVGSLKTDPLICWVHHGISLLA